MGCLRCFSRAKSFHVKIILLDKQELIQEVQESTTGQTLLDNIFTYLNLIETAYFGLRYQDNGNQTHWLDSSKRVFRQIHGVSPVTLYLGVKFYAADPCKLVEEITRYQFFLQVKLDILQGRLPVTQELSVDLAALALQSELGDYDPNRHSPGYVSEFRFMAAQSEETEAQVEAAHASMAGLGVVPATAEMTYLEKVKWLDMYGVDLHPVIGEDNIEYFLGLTPSGIIVLRNRSKVGNYFWPRITKIYFKGKYFMLRVRDKNNDENTYGFETPSRQACKHLWKCCIEHHAFFRLIQVSPSFGGTGIFSLGSRFKYSGHTQKEALQQVQNARRQPPQFTRRPSKRYSRRKGDKTLADHADLNGQGTDGGTLYRSASTSNVTAPVGAPVAPTNNPSSRLISEMIIANGSLKRQNQMGGRFSAPRHQRSNSGSSHHGASSFSNSLPRHISLYNNNNNDSEQNKDNKEYNYQGNKITEKETLQDISLQSLQWLESRGLFGGGGGTLQHNSKGANINNNPGSAADIVTSVNASGSHQFLDGINGMDGLSNAQAQHHYKHQNHHTSGNDDNGNGIDGQEVDGVHLGSVPIIGNGDTSPQRKPFVGSTPLSEEMYAIQMSANHGQHHHQRRSGRKSAATSDNESEASGMSWASAGILQGGHHSSHRRRNESGSESESRSGRKTDRRSRRKSRQGSYKLIESDEQWKLIQEQKHISQHRSSHRSASAHSRRGDVSHIQKVTSASPHNPVGMAMSESGGGSRRSGYVNSGAETEAEMISISSLKRTRRRRSRSRSPGESRSSRNHANQLPEEVLRHVEFGLVEPSGEDDSRLRGEIPFTNVETTRMGVSGRPVISSAAATTRSINRLHTKPRIYQRPPPSPPPLSTSSPVKQHATGQYLSTASQTGGNSAMSSNVGRNAQAAPLSSPSNNYSSNTLDLNNSSKHHLQQVAPYNNSPIPNYFQEQQQQYAPYANVQHQHTQPMQNYNENGFGHNLGTSNTYSQQHHNLQQYTPVRTTVPSSSNITSSATRMNMPSPISPSSAMFYNRSQAVYHGNVPDATLLRPPQQQNNLLHQDPTQNTQVPQHQPNHTYPLNSSSPASRVYTVNQPRMSPLHRPNHFAGVIAQSNSSTPIYRQPGPMNYQPHASDNTYTSSNRNSPAVQQQINLQGKSNQTQGNNFSGPHPVGLPSQINRTTASYQSPYFTAVSNHFQQQLQPSNRGSRETLDRNSSVSSPHTLSPMNGHTSDGQRASPHQRQGIHSQKLDMSRYNDVGSHGMHAHNNMQRQLLSKGNYALPPTVLTQATSHHQQNPYKQQLEGQQQFGPTKDVSKPTGDEMSTEL